SRARSAALGGIERLERLDCRAVKFRAVKFRRAIVIGTSRGCVAALLAAPLPGVARAEPAPSRQSAAVDATSDATPDVENEKALQTFREGIAAFDRRDFEAARVAFLQTFALKP